MVFSMPKPNLDEVICREFDSIKPLITAPFDYLHNIPSNNHNIRYELLHAFNNAYFRVQDPRILTEIGEVVGILHEASLLIDDIEDSSDMRRGQPAAHTRFGHALTINAGNYKFFEACQKANSVLPTFSKPHELLATKARISDALMQEILCIHIGQGQDLHWQVNLESMYRSGLPQPEDYLQMAMHKTGGLLRLLVQLLGVFSQVDTDSATALANIIGIIYQIRDDYLNLVDPRYAKMKGFAGEDLAEGKLSLPVLYALSCTTTSPVHRILLDYRSSQDRERQPELLEEALSFINTCGALHYSYDLLQEYVARGKEMVGSCVQNPQNLVSILAHLADVVKPPEMKTVQDLNEF